MSSLSHQTRTEMPESIRLEMAKFFNGYDNNLSGVVAPIAVWDLMRQKLAASDIKSICNGCGSKTTEAVPDTNWGLWITPICNIHDCTHELSQDEEDCDFSNMLLLTNHVTYINNNSNFAISWFRRYRATTYYNACHAAKNSYCPGCMPIDFTDCI